MEKPKFVRGLQSKIERIKHAELEARFDPSNDNLFWMMDYCKKNIKTEYTPLSEDTGVTIFNEPVYSGSGNERRYYCRQQVIRVHFPSGVDGVSFAIKFSKGDFDNYIRANTVPHLATSDFDSKSIGYVRDDRIDQNHIWNQGIVFKDELAQWNEGMPEYEKLELGSTTQAKTKQIYEKAYGIAHDYLVNRLRDNTK